MSARWQNHRNRRNIAIACSETTSLRLEVVGSIGIRPLMARSHDRLAIALPPAEAPGYGRCNQSTTRFPPCYNLPTFLPTFLHQCCAQNDFPSRYNLPTFQANYDTCARQSEPPAGDEDIIRLLIGPQQFCQAHFKAALKAALQGRLSRRLYSREHLKLKWIPPTAFLYPGEAQNELLREVCVSLAVDHFRGFHRPVSF